MGSVKLHTIKLETPSQLEPPKPGRPRKRKMPPLPQELLDGMRPLELEHFRFFLDAYSRDYPHMTPSDEIALHMAALEYVNLLRVQATQLATGQTITQARQHPGVQLRAWLDSIGGTRKQRLAEERKRASSSEEEDALREALLRMSRAA